MKKNLYVITLLIIANASINAMVPASLYENTLPSGYTTNMQESLSAKKWDTYKTIITGSLIGGLMGTLNYATDMIVPYNWLALSILRNSIVDDIAAEVTSNFEPINPKLLANCAWISDWIAYVSLYHMKQHTI